MKTPTKRTAHRLAAALAIVTAFAATGAWAANVKWTGAEDNYWNNTNNWKDKDSSRPLPTNDSMFFDSQDFNERFTENEVVFDGVFVNDYGTYIRNVGTAENPLVFRATSLANGLTFGNTKHTYIADNSAVYLRLKSGTWSTGGYNLEFGKFGSGCLELTDGASLTIGNYLHLQGGSLVLENATVTVADNRDLRPGANAMATIELNDGGTLIISTINQQTYGVAVRFNGGTLKANAANGNGLVRDNNTVSVMVAENGGTIDAGNFNIAVNRPIAAEGANDGGMTFEGGGSVSLKYANTYTGATKVELGTKIIATTADAKASVLANLVVTGVAADGDYYVFEYSGLSDADLANVTCPGGAAGTTVTRDGDQIKVHYVAPAEDLGWNGGDAAWATANAWTNETGTAKTWTDGNKAVFDDASTVTLGANATAVAATFNADATVAMGGGTLTVPAVTVASGVSATIAAPTAGALEKDGAGTLTLGSSRTDATTLTEGTLVANASIGTLVFGTANPVTFDYGGQTLSPIPASATGGDVTLKNGKFGATSSNFTMNSGKLRVEGDGAAMNMNQGSFGQANGTPAIYSQVGGTLKANSHFRLYRGEINLTNVMFTAGANIEVGNTSAAAHGAMTMSGCEASVSGNLNVFNGELVITNGATTVGNSKLVYMSSNGNSAMVALKAGGCLTAPLIQQYGSTGTGTIRFDGGTLKANAANSNGLVRNQTGLAVEVTANGGTIDAGKYNVTMHRPISGDGGMTFKGGGSVTLSAVSTYDGVTTVEVGTTLVVPEAIAGEKLALTIPEAGLEKGVYEVVRISGGGVFADDVLTYAALPQNENAQFRLNTAKTSIICIYGYEQGEVAYIGGNGGNLSVADNWTTGAVPTSGEVTFDFAAATTLTVGNTFKADTITIPTSSAIVTIDAGDLHLSGSLTNACKLAIAEGASLTVDGDIVVCDGKGTFLYSNEGTVTVAGNAVCKAGTTAKQYDVVTANTKPIKVGGFKLDRTGGRAYYRLESDTTGAGAWVVGANGLQFLNPANESQTRFYAQNNSVTLYSSDNWTLANTGLNNTSNGDLEVYSSSSLTIDTTDYNDGTTPRTVTLEGRVKADGNVTIAGCGTVIVATTANPSGLTDTTVASGKTLAVTDTATLQVNAGRKITGNGTISLAAGTTLALASTGREFATPDIVPVTLPAEGTATIRIDGTRLRSGEHVLCTLASVPENLADHVTVTGTALAGRKYEVKTVEVTENETTVTKLVLNIQPNGLMLIFR